MKPRQSPTGYTRGMNVSSCPWVFYINFLFSTCISTVLNLSPMMRLRNHIDTIRNIWLKRQFWENVPISNLLVKSTDWYKCSVLMILCHGDISEDSQKKTLFHNYILTKFTILLPVTLMTFFDLVLLGMNTDGKWTI